jgi:hypothetical protein
MNCCVEPELSPVELQSAAPRPTCASCQGPSHSVTLRTILLMLKPELFNQVGDGQYRFCTSRECPVVYFSRDGYFTTQDLRIRIGLKETEDPIPLCYCFGFDEQDLRAEIRAVGQTTIPQRVTALIKERMCACEERNPSGSCCLGEVIQAVKRLTKEAR